MKTVSYNIRLDPAIKAEAEKTFAVFGLNLSEAINVFLRKSIMNYGFPFDVALKPNDMLRLSLDEANTMQVSDDIKSYSSIEELNAAMDAEDAAEEENSGV